MLKGYLIDPEILHCEVVEIEDKNGRLENFYNLLRCDLIDITSRKIGGRSFDIVCDDEGLFKTPRFASACYEDGNVALVGAIFICNYGGNGELSSLTDTDIHLIESSIRLYNDDGVLRPVLLLSSYF